MVTQSKIERGTQGASRISRSMTLGFGLLRRQLWLWPVLAAAMLAGAGLWIRTMVEDAAKGELAKNLQTILKADVKALEVWMKNHQAAAHSLADDASLRKLTAALAKDAAGVSPDDPSPLLQSDAQAPGNLLGHFSRRFGGGTVTAPFVDLNLRTHHCIPGRFLQTNSVHNCNH